MALRFSPALQNFIGERGSWKDFFDNGSINIYTGAQPTTPDLAATGTLLVTLTSSAGALTSEIKATGVITLTGAAGSVDTITLLAKEIMGSSTAFNSTLTQTAADIALKINRNPKNKWVVATSAGAVITLTAVPGLGALINAAALATTVTTMAATVTSTTFGSGTGGSVAGVDSANGLKMDYNSAAGVFTKDITQTWSGTAVATNTAGWFRYVSSIVDAQALDNASPPAFMRMDGNIATSGANMNMSSTSITSGALQTLSTFSFTIPAA